VVCALVLRGGNMEGRGMHVPGFSRGGNPQAILRLKHLQPVGGWGDWLSLGLVLNHVWPKKKDQLLCQPICIRGPREPLSR